MRIALAQINPTLADFENNKTKILTYIQRAKDKKADLVIFPEASFFGYHPYDLLERESVIDRQNKVFNKLLTEIPADIFVLVGCFEKNKNKKGRPYYNAAFLCKKNKILKKFHKELLPTGDVFDEARFIEKGNLKDNYFKIKTTTSKYPDRLFFNTPHYFFISARKHPNTNCSTGKFRMVSKFGIRLFIKKYFHRKGIPVFGQVIKYFDIIINCAIVDI